jgi:hypothetical protein
MFRHYGLVAGQALPAEYPRLDAEVLNRHLAALPEGQSPSLTEDIAAIVQDASSITPSETDEVSTLAAVWAALLGGKNEAMQSIMGLLNRRGVNTSELGSATRDWVVNGRRGSYVDVLQRFSSTPIDVINYKADQPSESVGFEDLIGISAEVDAFAYLIASRSLQPPLAVGLFGAWGSGKTYFMDAIQRRIDQLIQAEPIRDKPQHAVPFWKRIVQVEFNAWHYVEGDLWSSLVDHIFTQLNLASEKTTDNQVEKRQRYLLEQLETTSAELKRLAEQKTAVERELDDRRKQVETARQRRDQAMEELRRQTQRRVAEEYAKASQSAVVDALKAVRLDPAEPITFGDALDTLAAVRTDLERGSSLLRPFLSEPRWLVLLFLALAGAPIAVWFIDRHAHSIVGAAFGGVSWLLTASVGAVGVASRWLGARLDAIEKAKQKVKAELHDAETEWKRQLEEAEWRAHETSSELEALNEQKTALEGQLAEIEQALKKKPPEILNEFLRERLEAGEYRKRLGVPAIIQRDFKGLGDLIRYQNAYLLAEARPEQERILSEAGKDLLPEDDHRIINRIVLYIDDLDRCPDGKVIEVLQAVHLLLAFPLFVVVVAVDSRWLAHALQTRYPALGDATAGNSQAAAPDDYLEKIFQVPFWVQPLGDNSRRRIIHGLLSDHIFQDALSSSGPIADRAEVGEREKKVLKEMVEPRVAPPLLDVKALTVSREELMFLDGLAPLMGETPRSVKRFVNVYQLIKILRRGKTQGSSEQPPDEQLAAFMLAIAEGLPGLSRQLFDQAASEPVKTTSLTVLLEYPALAGWEAERKRLRAWLSKPENMGWGLIHSGRLAELATDVVRFLFRVAPLCGAEMSVMRPQLVHVIQDR